MQGPKFERDEAKSRSNLSKHGISFADAQSLFESGVEYLELFDAGHSEAEDRFIALGPIARGLIVVAWTDRHEATIRIINARMATRREARLFAMRMRDAR